MNKFYKALHWLFLVVELIIVVLGVFLTSLMIIGDLLRLYYFISSPSTVGVISKSQLVISLGWDLGLVILFIWLICCLVEIHNVSGSHETKNKSHKNILAVFSGFFAKVRGSLTRFFQQRTTMISHRFNTNTTQSNALVPVNSNLPMSLNLNSLNQPPYYPPGGNGLMLLPQTAVTTTAIANNLNTHEARAISLSEMPETDASIVSHLTAPGVQIMRTPSGILVPVQNVGLLNASGQVITSGSLNVVNSQATIRYLFSPRHIWKLVTGVVSAIWTWLLYVREPLWNHFHNFVEALNSFNARGVLTYDQFVEWVALNPTFDVTDYPMVVASMFFQYLSHFTVTLFFAVGSFLLDYASGGSYNGSTDTPKASSIGGSDKGPGKPL